MVAMLKGAKRYILAPPRACPRLDIIEDKHHPSFRHSRTDWSDRAAYERARYDLTAGVDTVVREGEVLYIPSYWFHYIVSLSYSAQCNARSGTPPRDDGLDEIARCIKAFRSGLSVERQRAMGLLPASSSEESAPG